MHLVEAAVKHLSANPFAINSFRTQRERERDSMLRCVSADVSMSTWVRWNGKLYLKQISSDKDSEHKT